jgi:hypothetical protein
MDLNSKHERPYKWDIGGLAIIASLIVVNLTLVGCIVWTYI